MSSDGSESEEEEEEDDDDENSSTTSNHSGDVGASSNNSSAPSSSNNSTSNTKYKGKSAYEILREKNIERNNERLRSLGLLVGINVQQQNNHNSNSSGKKKRKKVAKNSSSSSAANAVATLPTRRSSRLKQPVVTEKGSLLEEVCHDGNEEGAAVPSNGGQVNIMEVIEEEFTVSPLFEYQMMSTNNNASTHTTNEDNEKRDDDNKNGQIITTLVPNGPRLNPPSGLNAIYSLQFHPHFLRGSEENHWLVGAGKAGLIALWDCSKRNHHHSLEEEEEEEEEDVYIDPVISWKGHGGRWIADARFIPPPPSSTSSSNNSSNNNVPSRLLTAGNDGTICHWDLTLTTKTGVPKLLEQSGKVLHGKSGIFSMDVCTTSYDSGSSSNAGGACNIVTGSKDKSLAITTLDRLASEPIWRSTFHTAKVGCVCFSSSKRNNPLIASASDDGYVAVHDSRIDGMRGGGTVATLEDAHVKPHSAVWKDDSDSIFMTGESSVFFSCCFLCIMIYNLQTQNAFCTY